MLAGKVRQNAQPMQINVSRPRIVTSTCTHQAQAQAQAEADALDTALVAILQHHELGQCEAVFAPFVSSSIDRRAPSYVACMPHDVCAFESKVHVRCCDKATLRCAFNCSLQLYTTACTAAGVLDRCRGGAHFVLSTLPSAKTAENAKSQWWHTRNQNSSTTQSTQSPWQSMPGAAGRLHVVLCELALL